MMTWLLSLFAFLSVEAGCADAVCRCGQVTPASAYRRADAVFTGTVVGIDTVDDGEFRAVRVRLRVDASWKGVDAAEMRVLDTTSMCSVYFRVGERYLVFSGRWPRTAGGPLRVSRCSGTHRLERSDEFVRALGPPRQRWDGGAARP